MDAYEYMTLLEQLERELTAWPRRVSLRPSGDVERKRVKAF